MNSIWWTGIGILLTFSIFLSTVIFRSGQLSARVDELEKWRDRQHKDMHEISDILGEINTELSKLRTLIEERTDRRLIPRETK
jgi:uncharacterized coiled-coil protein SlyX